MMILKTLFIVIIIAIGCQEADESKNKNSDSSDRDTETSTDEKKDGGPSSDAGGDTDSDMDVDADTDSDSDMDADTDTDTDQKATDSTVCGETTNLCCCAVDMLIDPTCDEETQKWVCPAEEWLIGDCGELDPICVHGDDGEMNDAGS